MHPRLEKAPLFRRQALEHAGPRSHGTVIVARPVSFSALTTLFVVIAIGVVTFLVAFSYTRKAQVSGVILPNLGLIRIVPTQTGVMLRPLANAVASSVNLPEVTTNPPVAPRAAMTPNNSRTTSTPTLYLQAERLADQHLELLPRHTVQHVGSLALSHSDDKHTKEFIAVAITHP